jgi:hypothetical protein
MGYDPVIVPFTACLKNAAHNALLTPRLTCAKGAVSHQAGEFGTGAGATGRAIIGTPWTEYEAPTVCLIIGGPKQFNVINFTAVLTANVFMY